MFHFFFAQQFILESVYSRGKVKAGHACFAGCHLSEEHVVVKIVIRFWICHSMHFLKDFRDEPSDRWLIYPAHLAGLLTMPSGHGFLKNSATRNCNWLRIKIVTQTLSREGKIKQKNINPFCVVIYYHFFSVVIHANETQSAFCCILS